MQPLQNENILSGLLDEDRLAYELLVARLKSYGKENFPESISTSESYIEFFREISARHSFQISSELSESFISFDNARYFLISEAPLIQKIEEYLNNGKKGKGTRDDTYSDLKRFYGKWALEKTQKEKEFYALTVFSVFERGSKTAPKEDVLRYLFPAFIHIYDVKLGNLESALTKLNTAEETLLTSGMPEEIKNELRYYLCIFRAFANLAYKEKVKAAEEFAEALLIKPEGITAQFYSIIYSTAQRRNDKISSMFFSIVNHDYRHFTTAISACNINMFSFFLKTAISYNFFKEEGFAPYLGEIKIAFESADKYDVTQRQHLYSKVMALKHNKEGYVISEKLASEILFLERFFERYISSKNLFIGMVCSEIEKKFLQIIDTIKQNIRHQIYSEKFSELEFYDNQTKSENNKLKKMQSDLEANKEMFVKKNKEVLEELEKKYIDAVQNIENKINGLDVSPEYDPSLNFNNVMLFNIIISIILFIIGAFIGSVTEKSGSANLGITLFISGIKWGGIVFLGGIIIAMLTSASKVMEKGAEKRKLENKITALKNQKEKAIERNKKDIEKKIQSLEDVYETRAKEVYKRIEELKAEKEEREAHLREEAVKEIENIFVKMDQEIGLVHTSEI